MKSPLCLPLICAVLLGSTAFSQDVVATKLLPKDSVSAQPLNTGRSAGTLDQVSPFSNASFNGDAVSLTWQSDVRVGIAGLLEGFEIQCTGAVGANIDLSIRLGAGWNTGPVVWSGNYSKATGSTEIGWLDTSGAGINLNVGDVFVIEWHGTGTGLWMVGSYVAPPGSPLYPEPLYLNAPGCFADCGWRLGFNTYMGAGGPTLAVANLIAGGVATVSVSGATPGGLVRHGYSLNGGGPTGTPFGNLLLSPPYKELPAMTADGAGNASVSAPVPAGTTGVSVWQHALDLGSLTFTNGLMTVIG
ncbi:MAG: hypothetical protein H8E31_00585 [Planctomycetes bacterium]|nr:hypothetical protein [Planctomycetota bacterium]